MSADASTRTEPAIRASTLGAPTSARDRLALPGVVVAALGFSVTGDPVGLAAAATVLLAWALAPPVAVATLGAFLFVAVGPGGLLGLLAATGLALTLLGPVASATAPATRLLATSAVAAVFGAVVAWIATAAPLGAAAGTLLLVAALLGYGVHRYEVVTVEQASPSEEVSTDG